MKKFICFLLVTTLCVIIGASATAGTIWPDGETSDEAISRYEAENGTSVATYRYHLMVPDGIHGVRDDDGKVTGSWYSEFSKGAGVFWWEKDSPAVCESWPGYRAMVDDAIQGVYYVDMPATVTSFIWNNGIDFNDKDASFSFLRNTENIPCQYAAPGEWDSMPEGNDNFDDCILILQPDDSAIHDLEDQNPPCSGKWYFYYGGGCYGKYATDSKNFAGIDQNCCNPDHFDESGVHVGFTDPLRGDYDWDNDITVIDATRAQSIIAGLYTRYNPAHIDCVDADKDGSLTVLDATRIQRVIASLCDIDGNAPESDELPIDQN